MSISVVQRTQFESNTFSEAKYAPGQYREEYKRAESESSEDEYIPPQQLLQHIVRMGSITSIPQINTGNDQDQGVEFPISELSELLERCKNELLSSPKAFMRSFSNNKK